MFRKYYTRSYHCVLFCFFLFLKVQMGSNKLIWSMSLMPYSPFSLSQLKMSCFIFFENPKRVALHLSFIFTMQSFSWRESQYLCIMFIEGKVQHTTELQTKMLHLLRAARMHKTTWCPPLYNVADVKQCFHLLFQDCNWCLTRISNETVDNFSICVHCCKKKKKKKY